MQNVIISDEYKSALSLIDSGCPFCVILGRAGTGKSTFIRHLQQNYKNVITVAPTGIAALNIGGQTIHSFFRFGFGPILDYSSIKVAADNSIYKKMDLLIIDEISMVRADLLDGIDMFLRLNRGNSKEPFGGVQVIAVGDVFQLPPVPEKSLLESGHYDTLHFFGSHAYQSIDAQCVEFSTVYRQKDERFIKFLNVVREGKSPEKVIQFLNQACVGNDNDEDDRVITLTCTNSVADAVNTAKLNDLPGRESVYVARVSGDFGKLQDQNLPAPERLVLKVGAQVMFVRNDPDGRWVNGTIGRVLEASNKDIVVDVGDEGKSIKQTVSRYTWERIAYNFDKQAKIIRKKVLGEYIQYPLKLAWAVTIHKAQGQSFDKIRLDLGTGAFAPGQLYVGLSRCRTIEGLSLVRPIRESDVKIDRVVQNYYKSMTS